MLLASGISEEYEEFNLQEDNPLQIQRDVFFSLERKEYRIGLDVGFRRNFNPQFYSNETNVMQTASNSEVLTIYPEEREKRTIPVNYPNYHQNVVLGNDSSSEIRNSTIELELAFNDVVNRYGPYLGLYFSISFTTLAFIAYCMVLCKTCTNKRLAARLWAVCFVRKKRKPDLNAQDVQRVKLRRPNLFSYQHTKNRVPRRFSNSQDAIELSTLGNHRKLEVHTSD